MPICKNCENMISDSKWNRHQGRCSKVIKKNEEKKTLKRRGLKVVRMNNRNYLIPLKGGIATIDKGANTQYIEDGRNVTLGKVVPYKPTAEPIFDEPIFEKASNRKKDKEEIQLAPSLIQDIPEKE